ncbi:MAG: hypothetical protein ACFFDH_00780 [Promethearchaeota archaeon]
MQFCIECGVETPEEELRSYSGYCRVCYQSLSEKNNEKSPYPRFYPNELKHLDIDKNEPRNQHGSIETTPVPSIEEIKRLNKIKIRLRIKKKYLIILIIILGLPFLLSFYYINIIAKSLEIDYLHTLINTYAVVAFYTNLIYYGIICLGFLIGAFGWFIEEDSVFILTIAIFVSILLIIVGIYLGNLYLVNSAPELFAYLKS